MTRENDNSGGTKTQLKARRAKEADLPKVCDMLASRMIDSVEASHLLDGICGKEKLINRLMTNQIEYIYRIGEVWIVGDCQGVLAGFYNKNFKVFDLIRTSITQNRQLVKDLSKTDIKQLKINMQKASGAQNLRWRKQVCGRADYYYIQLIAIDSSLKGSGAFRKLIDPILERGNRENMPVLLDTHDKSNVPIYEHFGFKVAREHHAKSGAPITQYSMIKNSNS